MRYFSEANKILERSNRSILERANALRFSAGLPRLYWKLACIFATYLKNRSPSRDGDITSREQWYSKKPGPKHYRVFGYPAYVQIPIEKRKKLSNKKWKGVFAYYHEDKDQI